MILPLLDRIGPRWLTWLLAVLLLVLLVVVLAVAAFPAMDAAFFPEPDPIVSGVE